MLNSGEIVKFSYLIQIENLQEKYES